MSPTRSIDMQSESSRSESSGRSELARKSLVLANDEEKLRNRREINRLVKRKSVAARKVKPKVKQVSWLDRVRHQTVTKGTVSYLTDGVRRTTGPQPIKGYMKPTEKWKLKEDLRERLQVEDAKIPIGLVDIIPDFFSLVRGRPIKQKFRKQEFISQTRHRLLRNLDQGFISDEIKRIEDQTTIQSNVLEDAVLQSKDMRKLMDLFLADQQKIAVKLEENIRKVREEREQKEAELKEVLKKTGNIRDLIHKRSVEIDKAMEYKKFLHEISSRDWTENYEKEKQQWKEGNRQNVDDLIRKVVRYKQSDEEDTSMDEVLIKFISEYENCGPVKIEFNTVQDVVALLTNMKKSNLEMATLIRDLKLQAAPLVIDRRRVESKLREYLAKVASLATKSTNDEAEMKDKLLKLQSAYKDIKRTCKSLIVSKEALVDLALLKEFYEEVTGTSSDNMTEDDMWRGFDKIYTDLKDKLKNVPEVELRRRCKEMRKKHEEKMNRAYKAKNRVMQVESIIRGIKKSYEQPLLPALKPVLPRSIPPPESPPSPSTPSTPGASYEDDLEEERELYFPIRTQKEMYNKVKKLAAKARKKETKTEEIDKNKILEEQMKRWMSDELFDDELVSSDSSESSLEVLTFMDPSLKLTRTDPAVEFVAKELEILKNVPRFEDFLALKNSVQEEEEEGRQNAYKEARHIALSSARKDPSNLHSGS